MNYKKWLFLFLCAQAIIMIGMQKNDTGKKLNRLCISCNDEIFSEPKMKLLLCDHDIHDECILEKNGDQLFCPHDQTPMVSYKDNPLLNTLVKYGSWAFAYGVTLSMIVAMAHK